MNFTQFFDRLRLFFVQSHRLAHLLVGLPVGFFGFDAAIICAIAFELKDVQHDRRNSKKKFTDWTWKSWDWVDFILTIAGSIIWYFVKTSTHLNISL